MLHGTLKIWFKVLHFSDSLNYITICFWLKLIICSCIRFKKSFWAKNYRTLNNKQNYVKNHVMCDRHFLRPSTIAQWQSTRTFILGSWVRIPLVWSSLNLIILYMVLYIPGIPYSVGVI